jgi:hypothetical protein
MLIQLTQNKKTIIDKEDFFRIRPHNWCFDKTTGYAAARVNGKKISLHRFIILAPKGTLVDHVNLNKLDNRKENLRIVNATESARHTGMSKNNTSGYKGVTWSKREKKWHSQIFVNYRNINLGVFDDKKEAAKAYNEAAIKYHGIYTVLNKI